MASDITLALFQPGVDLVVQIDQINNNVLTVLNKTNQLRGFLMSISPKNDIIFEKLLAQCKELNDRNNEKTKKVNSAFCVADSTLSHNSVEANSEIKNDPLCAQCKQSLKKVPKTKVSKEVKKLTNHGFNEDSLKMKSVSPRRGTYRGTYRLSSEKLTAKSENLLNSHVTLPAKDEEVDTSLNITPPKKIRRSKKRDSKGVTRPPSERALKTKANEKIINLCTKRKSQKVSEVSEPLVVEVEVEEKKAKVSTPIISDTSIYDFIDEDCESEPISRDISSLFVAKTTRRQRSATDASHDPNDVDVRSNPGVTYHENNGVKLRVNDIVWAKIPGYPFWPAHINSFDNVNLSKTCGKRCRINWIGWDQQSFLPLKSLLHFKEHFRRKYSPKLKSVKYKTAIGLACKELGLDFDEMVAEAGKRSMGRNSTSFGGSRRKTINLDEIFNCRGENTRSLSEFEINQDSRSEDEDTDEEEKARSALITVESLEANTKLSGLISKVD